MLGLAAAAPGQEIEVAKAELELARDVREVERRALVASNLPLTAREAEIFWPLYGDYRRDRSKASARRQALIVELSASGNALTDEAASRLLDEYLSLERADLEARTRWVKRFTRVLAGRQVARFFQIENKLDAQTRMELAALIPLVR